MELIAYTKFEAQKIQFTYVDEFAAVHDLDQNSLEELEFDAGTLPVETEFSPQSKSSRLNNPQTIFHTAPSNPATPAASKTVSNTSSSRIPPSKSTPSAHRRELVWKSQEHEVVSLEDIAHQFQDFLHALSTESALTRRRGRYTTKTAHRCPGYNRIEITLITDIARSAIVSHFTPTHEICPVCKEIVQDAEIFACVCGGDGQSLHGHNSSLFVLTHLAENELPTMKCLTCSEWHHRSCINIFENEDQKFVCQRCTMSDPNESGGALVDSQTQLTFAVAKLPVDVEHRLNARQGVLFPFRDRKATSLSPRLLLCSFAMSTYIDHQLRDPLLFALIIGINIYQEQPHLRGAVADAKAFKSYLMTSLGVDESRIICLFDQDATRAQIIQGFKELSENEAIQPGHDSIVIFFAGHGAAAPPPPGWEARGPNSWTQLLIAHDSSTEKNGTILGIPDFTVAALLDRIAERKGNNIVSFFASKTDRDFLLIHSADGYPRLLLFRLWNS